MFDFFRTRAVRVVKDPEGKWHQVAPDYQPAIICKVCDRGELRRRTLYRLNGVVVFIGYVLLIPSVVGMIVSALVFAASIAASGRGAPAGVGVVGGGLSIVAGIASVVGGLIGWLLIMKKCVLQCDICGATIDAARPHGEISAQRVLAGCVFGMLLIFVFALSRHDNSHPAPQVETGRILSEPYVPTPSPGIQAAPAQSEAFPVSRMWIPGSLPSDENALISTVSSFKTRYEQAPNEFQKSALRKARAAALAGILPSLSAEDWIGEISSMATTSDGNGTVCVRLPAGSNPIRIETWNNSLSDIGSGTLIPSGSSLYDHVAHLAVGDGVVFSGRFGSGDSDYLKEASMTEAGAMTDPEFIFTFTSIGRSKDNPPQAPSPPEPPETPSPSNPTTQPTPAPNSGEPISLDVPKDASAPNSQAVLLSKVDPEYSDAARKAGFAGAVSASITIDASGNVARVTLIDPPGLDLDDKIQRALLQWKYQPAMKNGVPIPINTTVTVTFRKP